MEHLEHKVPSEMINLFKKQAEQKIQIEGWAKQGRNVEVKVNNFVNCWVTEEAFKQLLIQAGVWFRNRGLYFGDSSGAGADFTVKIDGKEVSVGLRSVNKDSLEKWKTVAYPDDRFREEKEKIADYHVVCHNSNGHCRFFGIISKEEMLKELENSRRLYSKNNQEKFRVIPLEKFEFSVLDELIKKMDKI